MFVYSIEYINPTGQDEEERPRPEFAAKAPYLEKNPITGVSEQYRKGTKNLKVGLQTKTLCPVFLFYRTNGFLFRCASIS